MNFSNKGLTIICCCIGLIILGVIYGMFFPDETTKIMENTDKNTNNSVNESTVNENTNGTKVYTDGTYKVGSDLPAGEYKFTQTNSYGGYIERASDSSMELNSIISNDVTTKEGETKYVTVSNGEYLKIEGGEIIKV